MSAAMANQTNPFSNIYLNKTLITRQEIRLQSYFTAEFSSPDTQRQ